MINKTISYLHSIHNLLILINDTHTHTHTVLCTEKLDKICIYLYKRRTYTYKDKSFG